MVENNTGYFGQFGGCFVPEQLLAPLKEVEECFFKYINDPEFKKELGYSDFPHCSFFAPLSLLAWALEPSPGSEPTMAGLSCFPHFSPPALALGADCVACLGSSFPHFNPDEVEAGSGGAVTES